jgi:hypothetical protein
VADFDDERAAGIEEARRSVEYRSHRIETVFASRQREARLVPVFRRQIPMATVVT